jgi:hypothetical protein
MRRPFDGENERIPNGWKGSLRLERSDGNNPGFTVVEIMVVVAEGANRTANHQVYPP